MQKSHNTWSILIWSILLSSFLAIMFISISTKINNNIKLQRNIKNNWEIQTQIKNIIKNEDFNVIQSLDNNSKITFHNIYGLKHKEEKLISSDNTENIEINIAWYVYYEKKDNNWNVTWTWIIKNEEWKKILDVWSIILKNLWGKAQFSIKNKNYNRYSIFRNIGNKSVIQENGIIKNF